ncbi:amino acid permease-domain-containing protein, partial [Jimgerdemannia flammicorona]
PGSAAIISVIFGEYVSRIIFHTYFFDTPHDPATDTHPADDIIPPWIPKLLAIACVSIISLFNAYSVKVGTRVQDWFTILKLVAVLVIAVTGVVVLGKGSQSGNFQGDLFKGWNEVGAGEYSLGFYSGENNVNYVSGEMKNPHRDLPRVIFIGLPLVICCYLLSNVAYYAVLPATAVVKTNTIALDFGKKIFGPAGGIIFALCVAASCFGAANGSVFTAARIVYVSARQGYIPAVFGKISSTRHTPQAALALQCALTIIYILPGSFTTLLLLSRGPSSSGHTLPRTRLEAPLPRPANDAYPLLLGGAFPDRHALRLRSAREHRRHRVCPSRRARLVGTRQGEEEG